MQLRILLFEWHGGLSKIVFGDPLTPQHQPKKYYACKVRTAYVLYGLEGVISLSAKEVCAILEPMQCERAFVRS
jgi:hypothetical protein